MDSFKRFTDILYKPNSTQQDNEFVIGQSIRLTYNARVQKNLYSYMHDMNINGALVVMRTDGSLVEEVSTPLMLTKTAWIMTKNSKAKIAGIEDNIHDDGHWEVPGSGEFFVNDWFYKNGFTSGFSPSDRSLSNAFIISSNVVFAKTFTQIGADKVNSLAQKHFCFGQTIELDEVSLNNNKLGNISTPQNLVFSAFG